MLIDLGIVFLGSVLLGGLSFTASHLVLPRPHFLNGFSAPLAVVFCWAIWTGHWQAAIGYGVLAVLGGLLGGYLVHKTTSQPKEDQE